MLKTSITGKCKVFRNEFQNKNGGTFVKYKIGFSKKLQDGSYQNAYKTVRFRKGVELPHMADIEILEGWETFEKYKNKDGKEVTEWVVFVNDYSDASPFVPPERPSEPDYDNAFAEADEALPF